ncbi:hypothetical protein NHQ30_000718 [Ciborinia camelliae]|nr:hypothetical protein NHQ30_000718 [Ciborinia camelliae]
MKPNIGHSGAASGIFSVMKAAMMTETGVIPGVCGLQRVNPAIEEKNWNTKAHAKTKPWPSNLPLRRESVNSFGQGAQWPGMSAEAMKVFPSFLETQLLESFTEGRWTTHSEGMIAANRMTRIGISTNVSPASLDRVTRPTSSKRWYSSFSRLSRKLPRHKRVIVDDIEGSFISSLNRSLFKSLKKVLCSGIPILWLTAGVNESKRIGGSLAVGLIRAILVEQANTKITILDVDIDEHPANIMNAIATTMPKQGKGRSSVEKEVWFHNGIIHISRPVSNNRLSNLLAESSGTTKTKLTTGRAIEGTIVSGDLIFDDDSPPDETQLADTDIEVQVFASEINPADIHSQSQRARVITGKIVATGKNLDSSLLGRHIVTYTHKAFSTFVRVS